MEIVNRLSNYWKRQNIDITTVSPNHINEVLTSKSLRLPTDFITFYENVNGMGQSYYGPDWEGYSFHPIEHVDKLADYDGKDNYQIGDVIIFANYMHDSWLYGVKVIDSQNYEIGIIAYRGVFSVITNSLEDFIQLYLGDSALLYVN